MMDAYIEMGSLDVPIMVLPMPAPGMTGPGSTPVTRASRSLVK